ncbi:MAG: ZIP family metal transporter [Bacilli bacterium]|nr:ZIP family metal transporter [Bacilli bacterium]
MEKALFLTIIVSIFFLIGIFIPIIFKNKKKLILMTTGLTFIIMLYLALFDLFPEIIEHIENRNNLFICFFMILVGCLSLKFLDIFIPEHHHEHHEKEDNQEEHNNHLFHIGLITSISLIIHNVLEGISIYITGLSDFKLGLIMALTVSLHNLPLGIEISASLATKKNQFAKFFILFLLAFSSFFGAFFLFLFNKELNETIECILLALTLGMIIYIAIFELFSEVKQNIKQKEIKIGLILGVLLSSILYFL